MGILNKILAQQPQQPQVVTNTPTQQVPPPATQTASELSKLELELLMKILGDATIKGREVEVFYHMILKIQNQYIAKQQ